MGDHKEISLRTLQSNKVQVIWNSFLFISFPDYNFNLHGVCNNETGSPIFLQKKFMWYLNSRPAVWTLLSTTRLQWIRTPIHIFTWLTWQTWPGIQVLNSCRNTEDSIWMRLKETTSKISEDLKMTTKCACDDSLQIKKCTKQMIIKYTVTTQILADFFIADWNIPALKDTCDVEKKAQSK